MFEKIKEKPEEFECLNQVYDWYALKDGGRLIAYLATKKESPVQMAVHFEMMVPITKSVLRFMQDSWVEVLDMARFYGVKYIITMGDPEDKKWPKFLSYFGFEEPKTVSIAVQEV